MEEEPSASRRNINLTDLDVQIAELETHFRELRFLRMAAEVAEDPKTNGCTHGCTHGDCPETKGCTYGCTDGCTNGCTGSSCIVPPERDPQAKQVP